MNATLVGIALWVGAACGVIAAISAIALPGPRRALYLVAAVLFLPIGVMGLASVGIVFLAAAAACIVAAILAGGRRRPDAPSAPST